ncbi:DinB family protein [Gaetbulibacter sp. M235]|uniref:DinB family protein n=1 Tax=Gaetbulibacter sp. M235 TaxID=3126510 RepID=UPI00374EBF0B
MLILKSSKEYLWRPQPNKWCLLEIVCHLLDEEREDFKARVKHTLELPNEVMKGINPEGWVVERNYIAQNYNEKVLEFLQERGKSVAWLSNLNNVQWENIYKHPKLGDLSAKLFLVNWLAHDYLHMRQIIRYKYEYLKDHIDIDVQYAGSW